MMKLVYFALLKLLTVKIKGAQRILDSLFERLDRFIGLYRQLEEDASMVVMKAPDVVTWPNVGQRL